MTETPLTADFRECQQLEAEFDAYVNELSQVLSHADRIAPDRLRSQHQSVHHFVADAPWSEQALLDAVRN